MTQCQQLLIAEGDELEASVRRGDIYALMIQHCVKSGNFSEAKQLCTDLKHLLNKTNNTPITYYLSKEIIETLAQGLGVPISSIIPTTPKMFTSTNDDSETVEEILEQ